MVANSMRRTVFLSPSDPMDAQEARRVRCAEAGLTLPNLVTIPWLVEYRVKCQVCGDEDSGWTLIVPSWCAGIGSEFADLM